MQENQTPIAPIRQVQEMARRILYGLAIRHQATDLLPLADEMVEAAGQAARMAALTLVGFSEPSCPTLKSAGVQEIWTELERRTGRRVILTPRT